MLRLRTQIESFPIAGRFVISRGAKTEARVVTVTLEKDGFAGRGECVPYSRYGETVEGVQATIEAARAEIEKTGNRDRLQLILPPGAARNAVDSAFWDLESKLMNRPAHLLAGVGALSPVTTAYTISLDSPEGMAEAAAKASHRPLLKIKLGAPGGDFERIRAVRMAAPNARIIADANEGWTLENLGHHLEACAQAKFSLIEQPLPSQQDEFLRGLKRSVPLCADESVHDRASLKRLQGLYDCVNIKLDKTGGLTEALALAHEARALGFDIMVGCMVGTSLAMAPALLLANEAAFVDLDGPLLLAKDRESGLRYDGSLVHPPARDLWG